MQNTFLTRELLGQLTHCVFNASYYYYTDLDKTREFLIKHSRNWVKKN